MRTRALEKLRHQVDVGTGGLLGERLELALDGVALAAGADGLQAGRLLALRPGGADGLHAADLLALERGVDAQDRQLAFALVAITIHADDDALAAIDLGLQ